MRVLRTEGSNSEDWVPRLCTHRGEPYAILSHRWLENANHEVLFADILEIDRLDIDTPEGSAEDIVKNSQYADGSPHRKPGFKKLQGAARQALKDGLEYIWIDTCCIDKSSSAELSEAINSMFAWYRASEVCYAYLVDVPDTTDTSEGSPFAKSQWWKRGWTLQELLAPSELAFFTQDWNLIGNKDSLGTIIASFTGIDVVALTFETDNFSIAQRMSWASGRITTRPEDVAYCLMGLFHVNMPLLYGEGANKAFFRLQQEIIKDSPDESIFAWRHEPTRGNFSGMLATTPAAFARSSNVRDLGAGFEDTPPYSMTNKGLSITLPLVRQGRTCTALLSCLTSAAYSPGHRIGIRLQQIPYRSTQYAREDPQEWIECDSISHEISSILVWQSRDGNPATDVIRDLEHSMRLSKLSNK